jgi:thymidylate synthase
MAYTINVMNVNAALNVLMDLLQEKSYWRTISPRGQETLEWNESVFITEYAQPDERVLFSAARDANPYFHFFESLWILAGQQDVATIAEFNPRMKDFSDDGVVFHAPYGHRLRNGKVGDQMLTAIKMLQDDRDTRQVVMSIWDPLKDLNVKSKDIPCNTHLYPKIRDGELNLTVCCRSNDAIWGAYGANAVQFSMIQEFMARSLGVEVGTYTQISDSFHIYTANEAFARLKKQPYSANLYAKMTIMRPFPLMQAGCTAEVWLRQLQAFVYEPTEIVDGCDPFFLRVAIPLWESWNAYKVKDYDKALNILDKECEAYDWGTACQQWIVRRMNARWTKTKPA